AQLSSLPPSPPKTGTGKQTGSIRPTDAEKHTETEQATNETVNDSLPAIKSAPLTHIGKSQIAASESDKPPAQARGEAQTDGPLRADGATADSGDPGMAGPKPTIDSATQLLTATGHASSGPNALTSQPGSQPAAIPLAGIAVEIANRFEIRLDPPELGRIEVRLDVDHDGNVISRLTVDRADTYDLLRRDAAGLERALQDPGLKTTDNRLQFSLRDQSANQQQTNGGADTAQLVVQDELLSAIDVTTQIYNRLAGQGGGLDIRV
ncbi:MAG: flagellar hook-length control protein FliK, partial [Pseudolabrys sp.]